MYTKPVLYILMRTDMDSMNAGKGMAQAAHAANQFQAGVTELEGYPEWARQGTGFGTTIVLQVPSLKSLESYIMMANDLGHDMGIVHDSSYPVRDGQVTHLIPVDTCGYIFIADTFGEPVEFLKHLRLHP